MGHLRLRRTGQIRYQLAHSNLVSAGLFSRRCRWRLVLARESEVRFISPIPITATKLFTGGFALKTVWKKLLKY